MYESFFIQLLDKSVTDQKHPLAIQFKKRLMGVIERNDLQLEHFTVFGGTVSFCVSGDCIDSALLHDLEKLTWRSRDEFTMGSELDLPDLEIEE
jgi:hypothetical protein